jgi:hypothetical protein
MHQHEKQLKEYVKAFILEGQRKAGWDLARYCSASH